MTYKELLEITRNTPGCLWTKEQKDKHSKEKFNNWLARQNQKDEEEKKDSDSSI